MRKHLGMITSLLFLGVSTLIWTGCYNQGSCDYQYFASCDSCGFIPPYNEMCQTPQQPCTPTSASQPCEQTSFSSRCLTDCPSSGQTSDTPYYEPVCAMSARSCYPNSNELCCVDGITVRARNPKTCLLGDQYALSFEVEACDDVCDVTVTTHLPEGVTYLRSEPQAKEEGRKLVWDFGSLRKGECRPAKVSLECVCEGELCACFCATATPVRFCSLICAKPLLTCQKCGPKEVSPGDSVNYTVTVTNRGSCAAEDVCLTDNIPDGLEHNSGLKTLIYKLGNIQPGETKTISICLKACKRGEVCNTVVVSACNADTASCQWCTKVSACGCEVMKIGPKEQQIGKNSDYQITVTNTGDRPLTDVIVTDCVVLPMTIVAAKGAMINGNESVWKLRELKPGEKVSFMITATTCTPGCFTNKVTVKNAEGCGCSDTFATRWRGRPALSVCICDLEDPVCVGDPTSYCVTVVNQGSERDDNVRVVVRFPPEIVPVGSTGDSPGAVSGNTVTFAPYDNLGPRQTLKYRVDARAKSPGDGRVICEVSSDSIQTPIIQQESTIVQ